MKLHVPLLPLLLLGGASPALAQQAAPIASAAPAAAHLSARGSHACVIRANGDTACWGGDLSALAAESATGLPSGRPVEGPKGVRDIAAGESHACVVTAAGHVSCWGWNGTGALGIGPEASWHTKAVEVPGITDATSLAAGDAMTCAIRAGGKVTCWGTWDISRPASGLPFPVPGLEGVKKLSFGANFACALTQAGTVACFGDNSAGQAGTGKRASRFFDVTTPTPVAGLSDAIDIAGGRLDACALRKGGKAVCWGVRAGSIAKGPALTPVAMPQAGEGLTRLFLGPDHGCAEKADGKLACFWGFPISANEAEAKAEPPLSKVLDLVATSHAVWALNAAGEVLQFGERSRLYPMATVSGLTDATLVGVGEGMGCALRRDGTAACWGATGGSFISSGSMATPTAGLDPTARAVPGIAQATSLTVGWAHACVGHADGTASCWGANDQGQLGTGKRGAVPTAAQRQKAGLTGAFIPSDLLPREPAQKVAGLTNVKQLAAGSNFTCARVLTGKVLCWGEGRNGQLGQGAAAASLTPVEVKGLTDATFIAAGEASACAVRADGSVSCWGRNKADLLASDAERGDALTPIQIPRITGARVVGVGEGHACVATAKGVSCWGRFGNKRERREPSVATDVSSLSLGGDHFCLTTTGQTALQVGPVSCWGRNLEGAVGDGTRIDHPTAVAIQTDTPMPQIAAGRALTCGVLLAGKVACWGALSGMSTGDGRDTGKPLVVLGK